MNSELIVALFSKVTPVANSFVKLIFLTFDDKNNFFSARRSLRLEHADYGRNISIIMIN